MATEISSPVLSKKDDSEAVLQIRHRLHELNNLLTGILLSAGLLRPASGSTRMIGRHIDEIERTAEQAACLVNEIRGFVRNFSLSQAALDRTKVCDVRPSLGQQNGED